MTSKAGTPSANPDLTVSEAASGDRSAIIELAGSDAYAPLRYLRLFGHPIDQREQQDRVARQIDGEGVHLVVERRGVVCGQVTARPIQDLTDIFEVPVHDVGPVLVAPDHPRTEVAALLLAAVRSSVREAEPGFLLLRLEGDDYDAMLAAEATGFRLRETTLTFVNDLARRGRNPPPPDHDIRLHRFDIDGPLADEQYAMLRSQRFQLIDDHYHADPRLPNDRCDALYARVFDRTLRGESADALVIRYVDDRVASMGTWRHWQHLAEYGVSMAGSPFGFRSEDAPPGNIGVTSFACNESITGNDLLEWSTQATNFAIVNMVSRLPSLRHCRTSYMFHGWTDSWW